MELFPDSDALLRILHGRGLRFDFTAALRSTVVSGLLDSASVLCRVPGRDRQIAWQSCSDHMRVDARSARLAFLAARFSSSVFAGLRFCSLFWFMPLLIWILLQS